MMINPFNYKNNLLSSTLYLIIFISPVAKAKTIINKNYKESYEQHLINGISTIVLHLYSFTIAHQSNALA